MFVHPSASTLQPSEAIEKFLCASCSVCYFFRFFYARKTRELKSPWYQVCCHRIVSVVCFLPPYRVDKTTMPTGIGSRRETFGELNLLIAFRAIDV